MAESDKTIKVTDKSASFGGVYFITIIGAAVYFAGRVDGFWNIVLALLKAIVWPAFVVYRALELLDL